MYGFQIKNGKAIKPIEIKEFDGFLKLENPKRKNTPRRNYVRRLITNVSSILFFVLLSYIMTLVLQFMLVRPQRSAAIGYDMFFAYLSVFVCAVLSCIRYVEDIVRATVEYKEKRQAKEGV